MRDSSKFGNNDFRSLFGDQDDVFMNVPDALIACESQLPAAPSLTRTESYGLNQTAGELLLQNNSLLEEDVYRSVGGICALNDFSHHSESAFAGHGLTKQQDANSFVAAQCLPRLRSSGTHFAPVHAFCSAKLAGMCGENLVAKVGASLTAAGVCFGNFGDAQGFQFSSLSSSAFVCKAGLVRFDVYIFALPVADQARLKVAGGEEPRFVIEIQRVSSLNSCSEWSDLIAKLMNAWQGLCIPGAGYFNFDQENLFGSTCGQEDIVKITADDDDYDVPEVDPKLLAKEYTRMMSILGCDTTSFENKVQLAQVLLHVCSSANGAKALVELDAFTFIAKVLQAELVRGSRESDLIFVLCQILAKLAESSAISSDLGVAVTMAVLRTCSTKPLQAEQLHYAAKALAALCKHLESTSELVPLVRETAYQCGASSDNILQAHSKQVLQNLSAAY